MLNWIKQKFQKQEKAPVTTSRVLISKLKEGDIISIERDLSVWVEGDRYSNRHQLMDPEMTVIKTAQKYSSAYYKNHLLVKLQDKKGTVFNLKAGNSKKLLKISENHA